MSALDVFWMTLVSSALGFGGFGSLPVLRERLADAGVPQVEALLLQALTVGRVSPGPNGLFLVTVGYFVGGLVGAVAAGVAVLIPPFAILPIARSREALQHLPRFEAAMRALALAVVGLLAATAWSLLAQVSTRPVAVIAAAAGAVGLLLRVPALVLIGLAAALGATPVWAG